MKGHKVPKMRTAMQIDGGNLEVEVLGVKADLARRMPRPLPALGGHNQGRDLHPFSVNHAATYSRKCVVVRRNAFEGRI